jgi:hypothetical protein
MQHTMFIHIDGKYAGRHLPWLAKTILHRQCVGGQIRPRRVMNARGNQQREVIRRNAQ